MGWCNRLLCGLDDVCLVVGYALVRYDYTSGDWLFLSLVCEMLVYGG